MTRERTFSRRKFLERTTAIAAAATSLSIARSAYAGGSDLVKIALIGAGGRGRGAAVNALSTKGNFKLWAIADAFPERLQTSLKVMSTRFKDRVEVPPERQFVGLDAGQKAMQSGVDMVVLCEPPGFRPMNFENAVRAGKHVFMEKPIAVDGPGYRRVLAANEEAKKKGLLVAVGHHLRHEVKHREVVKRIRDGAIGPIKFLRAYFNTGDLWTRPREPQDTETMYQVRNWYHFTWLSGDHIVEQHVHDLDVANWIMGNAHPVRANGLGGRQVRVGKKYGEIFDHHAVEFEYADGTRLFSFCRQISGCWGSFSEHAHGTKGQVNIEGHGRAIIAVDGQDPVRLERGPDGHQLEWDDLLAALQAGQPYNELDNVAPGTMTAILGRMATYSGKMVEWDEAVKSNLTLGPAKLGPDGIYPSAMPGTTKAL
jgi:myo-inositol 2-dehydrogenase / D-chiro-inositol 1-dehydrogenase